MLAAEREGSPYEGDAGEIVNDAVWFCRRAAGFTDEAIERHLRN